MMPERVQEEAKRVYETVRSAAAGALDAGRAELSLTTSRRLYGDSDYDCAVILLSPTNPEAARVLVEVQQTDMWWLLTDDGPGTEFYAGMNRDRHAQLHALVEAVVMGRYTHGPVREKAKGIRSRVLGGWAETFETEDGPFTSKHFGQVVPDALRAFAPY
jgi:hypothetical protein